MSRIRSSVTVVGANRLMVHTMIGLGFAAVSADDVERRSKAAACNLALLMRSEHGSGKPRAAHDVVIDVILTTLAFMRAVEGHFPAWSVDSDQGFAFIADQRAQSAFPST